MRIGYRHSLAPALLLLPFLYAMFFTFPLGDDFARALKAQGLFDWIGGLKDLAWHWLHWSGRYTHHFLVVFLGDAVMTRAGYGAVCLGVLSLYGIALYGIYREIAAGARPQECLFLTLASLAALVAGHAALSNTFYVVTDALGLGIGNALVLMFVFALCRLWHLPNLRRRDTVFALTCAACAIGCYEHAAVATFVAAALALWMATRAQHPNRATFERIATATLVFLLASFLAPGNFSRQRIREVSLTRIFEQLGFAGHDWLASAPGAVMSYFAILAVLIGLLVTPKVRSGLRSVAPAAMAMASAAAFAALSAGIVVIHAFSDVRITAIAKLPASLHLLLGIVLAFALIPALAALRARVARVPAILVALPPIVLFAMSANTAATVRSIATGQLDAYAARMTQRLNVLAAVRNEDVRLAPLVTCPFPACAGEPVPAGAAIWPAANIAGLYGQRSVATAAPDGARIRAAIEAAAARLQWIRVPGSDLDAAYAALEPGPNRSYRDGWILVRGAQAPAGVTAAVRFAPPRRLEVLRRPRLAFAGPGLLGAPLGMADPDEVAEVFISLDGTTFHRLAAAQR